MINTGLQCTFASRMRHTEDRKYNLNVPIFARRLITAYLSDTEASKLMKQADVSISLP